MDTSNISGQVFALLASRCSKEISEIDPNSSITVDLGLDSVGAAELLMDVEEHFGIELPDAVLFDVRSVSDLINAIMRFGKEAA